MYLYGLLLDKSYAASTKSNRILLQRMKKSCHPETFDLSAREKLCRAIGGWGALTRLFVGQGPISHPETPGRAQGVGGKGQQARSADFYSPMSKEGEIQIPSQFPKNRSHTAKWARASV